MSSNTRRRARPLWPLIVALIVPPVVIGVSLYAVAAGENPESGQDLWVGEGSRDPLSDATSAQIDRAHEALHEIGSECSASTADVNAIAAAVDLIIAFGTAHPVGRFPIDDETATATSLLVVVKRAVQDCAPGEVEQVDAAIARLASAQ